MRNLKKTRFFSLGRKWIFTLALFLLVFAAASAVKIHAAGNVTGWLWGVTEEQSDGNPNNGLSGYETGVGWISMSGDNPEALGGEDYGVTIPPSDGAVTGYAWMNAGGNPDNLLQNGIGAIDFDPQTHCGSAYSAASCSAPDASGMDATKGGVKRVGSNLVGWARIVEIAKATVAPSNSGGWTGWIKMSGIAQNGVAYGVDVTKMKGVGSGSHTYAWSEELGAIDFGQAKVIKPLECSTKLLCPESELTSCDTVSYCKGETDPNASCTVEPDKKSWKCDWYGQSTSCPSSPLTPDIGECGTLDGGSVCNLGSISDNPMLCKSGSAVPSASSSSFDTSGYEFTWTCGGQNACAGSSKVSCSAKGKKACGWIETNP